MRISSAGNRGAAIRRHAAPGFTLLELLVTLTIIGMVATLAPPLFSAAMPGVTFDTRIRDVQAALTEARASAITSGQQRIVRLHPAEHRFVDISGDDIEFPESAEISLKSGAARGRNKSPDPVDIAFFPDGTATDVVIDFRDRGRTGRLSVSWLTGRATLVDDDAS